MKANYENLNRWHFSQKNLTSVFRKGWVQEKHAAHSRNSFFFTNIWKHHLIHDCVTFTIKNSGFHKLLIVTGNWHLCDSPTHTKWGHKWQDIKVLFLTLAKGNLKVFDRKLMSTFPWCLHFYLVICDTGLCLLMNLDWTEKGYKERYLKYFMSRNTLYCSVCCHTSIYIIVH